MPIAHLTLGEIAKRLNVDVFGSKETVVEAIGSLASAVSGQIAPLYGKSHEQHLLSTKASAVILHPDQLELCKVPALVTTDPKAVFAKLCHLLYPQKSHTPGVHPSVHVGKSTTISPSAHIASGCFIGDGVHVGDGVWLGANVVIGDNCKIGDNTYIYPNTTLYDNTQLGAHCIIHSGVVLGSDGFGFANEKGQWVKVPQIGSVLIGKRVEIGANTTIDCGAIGDTVIGNGCILDNQIQIGHNVVIGEHTAISACVGIAGSTKIGRYCLIGGASCFNGHIEICDGAQFVPGSMVIGSVTEATAYSSAVPAKKVGVWKRNMARFVRLDEMAGRIKAIEKQLAKDKAVAKEVS